MTTETIHNHHVKIDGNKAKAEYLGDPRGLEHRVDKENLKEEMKSRGFLALVTMGQRIYFRKRD
jgi:hypothetical protein